MEQKNKSIPSSTAVIIGAGPAGLTAAYELLKRTNIKPIIIEKTEHIGGISKTVNYKGNRIDIGGHRFFSKSDRVMQWWNEILPTPNTKVYKSTDQNSFLPATKVPPSMKASPSTKDNPNENIMLVRSRKSRIYFNRTFFDYPISITPKTILSFGLIKTCKIFFSYMKRVIFPIRKEKNLEQFFINRFGKEMYNTFFKSYTEKVWGIPCNKISASWGAQRIKGLSIIKAAAHFFKSLVPKSKKSIEQKKIETSLIAQFLYPKHGPGQMWETVAEKIKSMGGEILTEHEATKIFVENDKIVSIEITDKKTNTPQQINCEKLFSSMPIKDFVTALQISVPTQIKKISDELPYRDFITVGLLVNKLKIKNITDNWIYIQEPDVHVGRLQIFNNWSPYMVADPSKTWLGLEYFCNEGDFLWNKTKSELINLAKKELSQIDIINESDVIDATVIWQEKAYPAYFGTYDQFDTLKYYLKMFQNTFFIGRNGMHRYNNQDHSMLSSMKAVDNIVKNKVDNENVWCVNTEKEYHEEKQG